MNDESQKPLVLVTGGAGYLGQRICADLCRDHRVVAFDVNVPEPPLDDAAWRQCDLTDADATTRALDEVGKQFGRRVASVVHLAAYYDFTGKPSPLYGALTVEGTRRLLHGLREFEVEQFIFSSTLLVMKSVEGYFPLDESSPLDAEWDYPRSKLEAEKVIDEERGEIPALILRIAGVYDEDCRSIPIAQQIARIYEKQLESYFFPGDATHGSPYIHRDDVVRCIRAAVLRRLKLPESEKLMIGEEDVMTYEELQEALGELIHGRQWPTIRIPKTLAKAGAWVKTKLAGDDEPFIRPWMIDLADQNYPIDIGRARTMLQWEPRHTLRETLPKMIRRLKDDPLGWYEINGLSPPGALRAKAAKVKA